MIDNPNNFKLESTTVWSFPNRGKWATHSAEYRGNFAPQVARNLISKYTKERDWILDPMVGSGTSLIEAKLLHRNALGLDINEKAINLCRKKLSFEFNTPTKQFTRLWDARNLSFIEPDSIKLVIFHPPYHNIIKYSDGELSNDLSSIESLEEFLEQIEIIALELKRIIKANGHCALLIGDARKKRNYIPLSFYLLEIFLKHGFILKEQIIKLQHNTKFMEKWKAIAQKQGFYLISHEHLFIFTKT